jgi:hypothetical protein
MKMLIERHMLAEHDMWVIFEMARESLCFRNEKLYLIRLNSMFEQGLNYGIVCDVCDGGETATCVQCGNPWDDNREPCTETSYAEYKPGCPNPDCPWMNR